MVNWTLTNYLVYRYNIATEIAQATAINTMRRAKGVEPDPEFSPLGTNKMDLLQVVKMHT